MKTGRVRDQGHAHGGLGDWNDQMGIFEEPIAGPGDVIPCHSGVLRARNIDRFRQLDENRIRNEWITEHAAGWNMHELPSITSHTITSFNRNSR